MRLGWAHVLRYIGDGTSPGPRALEGTVSLGISPPRGLRRQQEAPGAMPAESAAISISVRVSTNHSRFSGEQVLHRFQDRDHGNYGHRVAHVRGHVHQLVQ